MLYGTTTKCRIPTLTTNHTYYFSYYATIVTAGDKIWLGQDSDNAYYLLNHTATQSKLFNATFTVDAAHNYSTPYLAIESSSSDNIYSRFILIDLTEAFGSGLEPTSA